MTVAELLRMVEEELCRAGIEEWRHEAQLLICGCLGLTRTQLLLGGGGNPPGQAVERLQSSLERRRRREPLAYIFGEQEFWSLPFIVSPAVLIPRPETEFLIDRVLALADPQNLATGAILDLCCGSGVIATVLARETGRWLCAADLSPAALGVASVNLHRHGVREQVSLVAGDLFGPFARGPMFSLVVTNPPYVARGELASSLQPEVAGYEPHLALDGGDGGLTVIEAIRGQIHHHLRPGGQLFMEIGADQGARVVEMFSSPWGAAPAFAQAEVLVDYAGRDRVLHARLAGQP